MKKKIIFLLSLLLLFVLLALFTEKEFREVEVEESYTEESLQNMTSVEVDTFLQEIAVLDTDERLEKIITSRLGTPYEEGCLGENGGVDTDPVFRLDVADCTVFVLTSVALLNSSNLEDAEELMKSLNYYPFEEVSYENRLHFTTYRNLISPYFEDITEDLGVVTESKTINLNKTRIIDIDFEESVEVKYIPYTSFSRDAHLPPVVGVAFLRHGDEERGLDVRHEGFILHGEDLVHASLNAGEVVREDLFQYLQNASFDGLIIFEIKSF